MAVADVFGGCVLTAVEDSLFVAGSGWEVVVCDPSSGLLELSGEEMWV